MIALYLAALTGSPQQSDGGAKSADHANRAVKYAERMLTRSPTDPEHAHKPPHTTKEQREEPLFSALLAWIDGLDPNRVIALLTLVLTLIGGLQCWSALTVNRH